MQSRCLPAIYKLLDSGSILNKYTAAAAVHCDQRTAQRILTHLHVVGEARIFAWIRSKGFPIPIYTLADGKSDAAKPKPLSIDAVERSKKRQARKQLKQKKVIGIWGI